MIIGIDIRVLGNHVKSGIEEYTENLLVHMLALDSTIKFKLFFSSWNSDTPDYDWLHLPNVELHKFKIPNKFLFASPHLCNAPKIDKLIGGADIFFSPHFLLSALSPECKKVMTFHDLSYIRFPEFLSWRRSFWHRVEMRPGWQSKFSDKMIAVSESTKKDLISLYDIDPAKIEIIHSGISPAIKRPADELLSEFKTNNNLPDEFILFLGTLEPRKNISGLVKAFDLLKQNHKFNKLYLIVVGSRGWLSEDMFKQIESSPFKEQIILKGHIKNEDRAFYYSLASVFVYPSFFEGFGFPPLEAMACGTPVIVSNSSSLPEVVAKAGLLIDPHSINEIALAISAVLTDKKLKESLISLGLERVQGFTWQKTAEKTLEYILK
ncbi:MAG: glycosyltransferase family 1 protein [Candidatus Taylorbacteria bacterium]|nr:glycosyltransferase family 1 protein [Candidatus Taylorbacteria bacterium]